MEKSDLKYIQHNYAFLYCIPGFISLKDMLFIFSWWSGQTEYMSWDLAPKNLRI